MIGNHPDIECALRTGYPEGMDLSCETCECCQAQIYYEKIQTDCGLYICRDCIELCDGCKESKSCAVSGF